MIERDALELAKRLAVEAGTLCLDLFGRVEARYKGDRSVVTRADIEAQRLIESEIRRAFPDHAILGEEDTGAGTSADLSAVGDDRYVWVVDPLDGTDGYRAGLPGWGTAIGLMRGGRTLLGVFYAPMVRQLYWATADGPAYADGEEIHVQPGCDLDHGCFLAVYSTFHHAYRTTYPAKVRSMGSMQLHLCYVARGAACGAVVNGHVWDIAVGMLLVERAGGRTRYLDGSPIDLRPLLDGRLLGRNALAASSAMWQPLAGCIEPLPPR